MNWVSISLSATISEIARLQSNTSYQRRHVRRGHVQTIAHTVERLNCTDIVVVWSARDCVWLTEWNMKRKSTHTWILKARKENWRKNNFQSQGRLREENEMCFCLYSAISGGVRSVQRTWRKEERKCNKKKSKSSWELSGTVDVGQAENLAIDTRLHESGDEKHERVFTQKRRKCRDFEC